MSLTKTLGLLGVYFKWIQPDQLFVSTSGRLVMAGLTGAVYGSHVPCQAATAAQTKDRGEGREKSRDKERDKGRDKDRESGREKKKDKSSHEGKEKSSEKAKEKERKRRKLEIPVPATRPLSVSPAVLANLETASPEVIAGAEPSAQVYLWITCSYRLFSLCFDTLCVLCDPSLPYGLLLPSAA